MYLRLEMKRIGKLRLDYSHLQKRRKYKLWCSTEYLWMSSTLVSVPLKLICFYFARAQIVRLLILAMNWRKNETLQICLSPYNQISLWHVYARVLCWYFNSRFLFACSWIAKTHNLKGSAYLRIRVRNICNYSGESKVAYIWAE